MENRTFKKEEVPILIVWLGGRLWDASDLDAFQLHYCFPKQIETLLMGYPYPLGGRKKDLHEIRGVLSRADKMIEKEILKGVMPAVFVVTTWKVIEFAQKHKLYEKHKPTRPLIASLLPRSQLVFNYLVIMDGGYYWSREETDPYTENEKMAHKVGGLFLSYNTDAPTAGGERLFEFIFRVMGYDLEGDNFPQYGWEDLKRMAWHIKRENFNAFSPREGAIPKYQIDQDGRPIFADCLK